MKTRLGIFLLVLVSSVATVYGQGMATLTGTVTDSDTQNWSAANVTFQLNIPGGGTPINKLTGAVVPNFVPQVLTSAGAFTGTNQITRTDDIIPAGATWTAQVCSNTSAPCQSFSTIIIAAASFNMGAYLSARITAPRFPDSSIAHGYATVEVSPNPAAGVFFYNVQTSAVPTCNQYTPSGWVSCAAGAGAIPGGTPPAIQFNSAGAFGGLSVATRGALQEDGLGHNFYSPTYAPLVTDPPYNAHCDGSTDDTAAIQAAMDNNAAIQLPLTNDAGSPVQCNVTSLHVNNASLDIYFNGSFLASTTTATVFVFNNTQQTNLYDGTIELLAASGTPTTFDFTTGYQLHLVNMQEYTANSITYTSLTNVGRFANILLLNSYVSGEVNLTSQQIFVSLINSQFNGSLTLGGGNYNNALYGQNCVLPALNGTTFGSVTLDNCAVDTSSAWTAPLFSLSGSIYGGNAPTFVTPPTTGALNFFFVAGGGQAAYDFSARKLFNGATATDQTALSNNELVANTKYVDSAVATSNTSTQTNCLSVACTGGSTYTTGVTYTNNTGHAITEEITYNSNQAATGGDSTISGTVNGSVVQVNGLSNQCQGSRSISLRVPTSGTFSVATAIQDGCSSATLTITSWMEINR